MTAKEAFYTNKLAQSSRCKRQRESEIEDKPNQDRRRRPRILETKKQGHASCSCWGDNDATIYMHFPDRQRQERYYKQLEQIYAHMPNGTALGVLPDSKGRMRPMIKDHVTGRVHRLRAIDNDQKRIDRALRRREEKTYRKEIEDYCLNDDDGAYDADDEESEEEDGFTCLCDLRLPCLAYGHGHHHHLFPSTSSHPSTHSLIDAYPQTQIGHEGRVVMGYAHWDATIPATDGSHAIKMGRGGDDYNDQNNDGDDRDGDSDSNTDSDDMVKREEKLCNAPTKEDDKGDSTVKLEEIDGELGPLLHS
jgi:hypothetical protein